MRARSAAAPEVLAAADRLALPRLPDGRLIVDRPESFPRQLDLHPLAGDVKLGPDPELQELEPRDGARIRPRPPSGSSTSCRKGDELWNASDEDLVDAG